MLTHLTIQNLAISRHVDIEFNQGMSAITGETGAGKSILIDSLGYVLGDRADSSLVRQGEDRAEIVAEFNVRHIQSAKDWLQQQELDQADECILRRTISREGRSRAFVNGQPVPLQQLKQLGNLLLDIHSQHEHHSLLQTETQRRLLDEFAGHEPLVNQVTTHYQHWRKLHKKVKEAREHSGDRDARTQLLRYQLEELDQLGLSEGELTELENTQNLLAQGEDVIKTLGQVTELGHSEDGGLTEQLRHCINSLGKLDTPAIQGFFHKGQELLIQAEDWLGEMEHFADNFDLDAARLFEVNERLTAIYQLARKHQVLPEQLVETHISLKNELEQSEQSADNFEEDQALMDEAHQKFTELCAQLTTKRSQAARHFEQLVTEQLQQLSLQGAHLQVRLLPLESDRFAAYGAENIEFHISTNPGQPAGSLAKIASGGELSRISLAIQVICAESSQIPTLVFDEVDVGISGGTSELVGRMLRLLGERGQVICVTHQPQVSSLAHHHMKVAKLVQKNETLTQMSWLNNNERVEELARLLGGVEITNNTLNHAREMLTLGQTSH